MKFLLASLVTSLSMKMKRSVDILYYKLVNKIETSVVLSCKPGETALCVSRETVIIVYKQSKLVYEISLQLHAN